MLVLGRSQTALHQAQATGHAQVADQTAGLGLDQQVLGAPLHALDTLTGEANVQIFRNRPAQTTLTHDHAADTLPLQVRRYTAASGFDFRQFGHI